MDIIILGIESSCDETSAAILRNGEIVTNIIATQAIHKNYGGVVPELASRAHQSNIIPTVSKALSDAKIDKSMLNAVAFTRGPGLLGALLVGTSFAKAFALGLGIKLIDINHMQAHILAHFIEDPKPTFPFLCLTVSGGHTQIVLVKGYLDMEIIGSTQDDAVGEAFDKTAKLLNFPYPGGPLIDKYAQKGNPSAFSFPLTQMPALNYSFSGIKTAFLYFLKDAVKNDANFIDKNLEDICASIQHTLITMLMSKLIKASKETGIKNIAIAGGVSANSGLRSALTIEAEKRKWNIFIPDFQFCTDNAAMIAMAGYFKFKSGQFADLNIDPSPRMSF